MHHRPKGPSAEPLYQQVKDYISERIRTGTWEPEARIPSENQLVRILGVSRMTVNRALRELSADGDLVRVQGVGTFVSSGRPRSALFEIRSIADEIRERGGIHSSDVVVLAAETAGAEIAAALEMPPGTPVFHARIVHRDRGRPVQLADRYVRPSAAPDFLLQDFTRITPSEYLAGIAPISEVEHVIEAIMPDTVTRRLLEIDPSEPCIVLHRRTWAAGTVATTGRFFFSGSRFRLEGRFRPVSTAHRTLT